jgi:hypothetical protein
MDAFGHILDIETGESLASVKDGKITGVNGSTYTLEGDKIKDSAGAVVGYLSQLQGPTKRNGDLANKLFRRR